MSVLDSLISVEQTRMGVKETEPEPAPIRPFVAPAREYADTMRMVVSGQIPPTREAENRLDELGSQGAMQQAIRQGLVTESDVAITANMFRGAPAPVQAAVAEAPVQAFQDPVQTSLFGGANEVFAPPVQERNQASAFERFGEGFARGTVDALTAGFVKSTDIGLTEGNEDLGTAGTVGNIVGFIAGELPWFMVGAGIAKRFASATRATHAFARSTGFGAKAKAVLSHPETIADLGVGLGLEGARRAGGDPNALSAERTAFTLAAPFLLGLRRARKLTRTPEAKAFHALPPEMRAIPFEDLELVEQTRQLWKQPGGDVDIMPMLRTLYKSGAPLEDIRRMYSKQDVAEYTRLVPPTDEWAARAAERRAVNAEAVDLAIKIEGPPVAGISYEPPVRSFSASAKENVDAAFSAISHDSRSRTGLKTGLVWEARAATSTGRVITGIPGDGLSSRLKDAGAPSGASVSEDEAILKVLRKEMEMDVLIPPDQFKGRGAISKKMGEWYNETVAHMPYVNRAIVTTARVLDSYGPEGRSLSRLAMGAREITLDRTGSTLSDLNNVIDNITPKQVHDAISAADGAIPVEQLTEPGQQMLYNAWRGAQQVVEKEIEDTGLMIRVGEGPMKGQLQPINQHIVPHFWPRYHEKIDDALENTEVRERLSILMDKEGLPKGIHTSEVLDRLVQRKSQQGTMSLNTRDTDLPGYLGDPKTFNEIGGEKYVQNVKKAMGWFFEDNYQAIENARAFGTPSSMNKWDDGLMISNPALQLGVKKMITLAQRVQAGEASATSLGFGSTTGGAELDRIAAFGDDVQGLLKASFKESAAGDNTLKSKIFENVVTDESSKISLMSYGGTARRLIEEIGIKHGSDASNYAADAIDILSGMKTYGSAQRNWSRRIRGYHIITKLGLAVIENSTQSAFTATNFGMLNTYRALQEAFSFNPATREAAKEFARSSGVLVESGMRSIETDLGDITGKFLKYTGFSYVEDMNRTVAASAAKHWVRDQMAILGVDATSKKANTTLRQMTKLGFNMDHFVKDGEVTEWGRGIIKSMKGNGDKTMAQAIERLAGFRGVRATQFMSDVMNNPIMFDSPAAKMIVQFKTFVTGAARAFTRDVLDEAANGNFKPLGRMVLLGATMGELSQDIRATVSGRDPMERGQDGMMKDLMKGLIVDQDDPNFIEIAGRHFSKSDLAARVLENVAGVGYAGIFFSMAQSTYNSGKVGLLSVGLGPTVEEFAEVAGQIVKGDPRPLGRRAIREGTAALGAFVPLPGAPLITSSAGRSLQLAFLPSEKQKETSLYLTPEETGEMAARVINKQYMTARKEAAEFAEAGDQPAAVQRMKEWNQILPEKLEYLKEFNALNRGRIMRIHFSGDDMRNLLSRGFQEAQEPGAFAQGVERAASPFQ